MWSSQEMGQHYTDLPAKRAYILQTITDEEERFHRTLHNGLRIVDDLMARMRVEGRTEIDGQEAFFLWDTFGFPIDLTRDVAQDNGFTVDEAGFRMALAEQKEKSRATAVEKVGPDLAIYAEVLQQLKDSGVVDTRRRPLSHLRKPGRNRNQRGRADRRRAGGDERQRGRPGRDRAARNRLLCGNGRPGQRYGRNLLLARKPG